MKKRNRRCDPEKQRYWEEVLGRWKESGQSVRDFCRAEGLRESAFYFWRRELARRSQPRIAANPAHKACRASSAARSSKPSPRPRQAAPAFLPVRVVTSDRTAAAQGVEIVLEQGRTVRVQTGFDRHTLAEVLAVLEARSC
jgi:hypothetical protein